MSPTTSERDAVGHPWLWSWSVERRELVRIDGRALAAGPVERWPLPLELQAQRLFALAPGPAPDPATVVHADELAELLALEPSLADAWRECFDH